MNKKFYKVEDFYSDPTGLFKMEAASPISNVSPAPVLTIVSADDMLEAVTTHYGERSALMRVTEPESPAAQFLAMWQAFCRHRGQHYAAVLDTLLRNYNPIENYNSIEEHSGDDTVTKTPDNWKTTETKTPTNWKNTTTQTPTNWKSETTETPNNWKTTETRGASNDYKETETEVPTNWTRTLTESASPDYVETDTEVPTNWKNTEQTQGLNNYKETETQKPQNWQMEDKTAGGTGANRVTVENKINGFNSSSAVPQNSTQTDTASDVTHTQTGTFATERTRDGILQHTNEQSGTLAHEKTFEGEKTTEDTQDGTYAREKTFAGELKTETEQTGSFSRATEQTGTYKTEAEQTGTFKTETEQAGTMEDKTAYNSTVSRHGNIGVMSTQDMEQQEIELRRKAAGFVDGIIAEFFNTYTVYI